MLHLYKKYNSIKEILIKNWKNIFINLYNILLPIMKI